MSKPRTATLVLDGEQPDTTDPLEGIDAPNAGDVDAAFAITDELRGTAGVTLQFTRVWPTTPGVVGHCGEMSAEEYSLAEAARRYGPGKYTVRLKGADNRYMKGGGKLNIAGNPQAGPAPAAPAQSDDRVLQLLESMARRDDERQREKEARNEKFWQLAMLAVPSIPAIIGAMRGGGGDNIAALITALKPAPGPTLPDLVATLNGMKSLTKDDTKATDPIEQVSKLLEVAQTIAGKGEGGGSESNWVDIVRDALKAAPDFLQAIANRPQASVPVQIVPNGQSPQPMIPTVQPAEDAPAQPESIPTGEAEMLSLVTPILKEAALKIEKWAKEKRDPVLRAGVLLEELPAWLVERIKPEQALELLNNPQWWEHLTQFYPALANYKPWIEEARAELIDIVKEQMEAARQPPTE